MFIYHFYELKIVFLKFSDDRSVDAFRRKLDETTQMTSVLSRDKRPNCLIIDEIDGAPLVSRRFINLINY